jgi:hypothetical protein
VEIVLKTAIFRIQIQVSTIELSQFEEKNNLRVPHCHDLEESCDDNIATLWTIFKTTILPPNRKTVVTTALPPFKQMCDDSIAPLCMVRKHCHPLDTSFYESVVTINTKVVKTAFPPSIQRLWRQHFHHQYKGCEDSIYTINTKVVKTAFPPSIQRLWRQHFHHQYKGCEDSISTINTKVVKTALPPSIQRLWRRLCHHQYKGCKDSIATINTKVVKTDKKGCEDIFAT